MIRMYIKSNCPARGLERRFMWLSVIIMLFAAWRPFPLPAVEMQNPVSEAMLGGRLTLTGLELYALENNPSIQAAHQQWRSVLAVCFMMGLLSIVLGCLRGIYDPQWNVTCDNRGVTLLSLRGRESFVEWGDVASISLRGKSLRLRRSRPFHVFRSVCGDRDTFHQIVSLYGSQQSITSGVSLGRRYAMR